MQQEAANIVGHCFWFLVFPFIGCLVLHTWGPFKLCGSHLVLSWVSGSGEIQLPCCKDMQVVLRQGPPGKVSNPLRMTSTNSQSMWTDHLKMNLPSILRQDFKILRVFFLFLLQDSHPFIHSPNTFHLFLTRYCCRITLRLHPRKRWWTRFFSHISCPWLVVTAHVSKGKGRKPFSFCNTCQGTGSGSR